MKKVSKVFEAITSLMCWAFAVACLCQLWGYRRDLSILGWAMFALVIIVNLILLIMKEKSSNEDIELYLTRASTAKSALLVVLGFGYFYLTWKFGDHEWFRISLISFVIMFVLSVIARLHNLMQERGEEE